MKSCKETAETISCKKDKTDAIKKQKTEKTDYHEFSGSCFSKSTCSASDCTGLIPALPASEAELEAYEELYPFCQADEDTIF